jgi:hypothetical protein
VCDTLLGGICVGNDWLLDNLVSLVALARPPNTSRIHFIALDTLYAAIQTRLQPTQPLSFLSVPTDYYSNTTLFTHAPKRDPLFLCANLQSRQPQRLAIKSGPVPCQH